MNRFCFKQAIMVMMIISITQYLIGNNQRILLENKKKVIANTFI